MSGVITAAIAGITWCFCTASASLCSSWCGNDKASSVPPSATSGRRRSVLLLALSFVVALAYQYGIAPHCEDWPYLADAWSAGCKDRGSAELARVCSGNAGVYRAASAAFAFFVVFGVAVKCRPTSNREAWPAKYALFLFLAAGTIFIPNTPLFNPIFLWVARVGSLLFVLFQQLILVDIAYNWNTAWVARADRAELDEGPGQGRKWLAAILIACGILYGASLAGIITMFVHFSGCATNNAFISVTLVMSLLCSLVQLLTSETGSLLTSGFMTLYATYLCGAAVSKNPDAACNPKLGDPSVWSIAVGLMIAFVSMLWTGWSYTTTKRLGGGGHAADDEDEGGDGQSSKAVGLVVNDASYGTAGATPPEDAADPAAGSHDDPASFGSSWRLNGALALICCWYAMTLTGWGAIENRGDIANPDVGEVSMWILVASQWMSLLLYLWTLIAPTLFPDRDFS